MRTAADVKKDKDALLQLPKIGDIFFIENTRFKVWDLIEKYDDHVREHIAEMIVTSKHIKIKLIINSSQPFGKK